MKERKVFAGIDLGGTNIKIGIITNGEILATTHIEAEADHSMRERLPVIRKTVDLLLTENHITQPQLRGVGLSFPSIVDNLNKKILSRYVKFADADELDLNQWSLDCWGVPLALENDARAALVAEWQYGAGRGYNNIVQVTLGTGFGSGVLINGQLFRGAHHVGGNLGGHVMVNFTGSPCNCGAYGCMETEASGWVVHDKWKDHPMYTASRLAKEAEITYRNIFKWASEDDLAKIILDHSLKAWSANVYNLVHNFDPEVVIMGGGIMMSGDLIVNHVQSFIDQYCWQPAGTVKVVRARHSEFAGMLGMAYLAGLEST
ncbi:MAG: ROK family protein [Saprospiraceae bacterium]|nr:ROK family protein [Saprospiraceae bacterium]